MRKLSSDYNMDGLDMLHAVPNAGTIVERVDLAATKATMMMRTLGLSRDAIIAETDARLRELLNCACIDFAYQDDDEAEGWAEDDLFAVTVMQDPETRQIHTEILMRLA